MMHSPLRCRPLGPPRGPQPALPCRGLAGASPRSLFPHKPTSPKPGGPYETRHRDGRPQSPLFSASPGSWWRPSVGAKAAPTQALSCWFFFPSPSSSHHPHSNEWTLTVTVTWTRGVTPFPHEVESPQTPGQASFPAPNTPECHRRVQARCRQQPRGPSPCPLCWGQVWGRGVRCPASHTRN
ncbi:hypothetical protein HJG60_008697 [Phyllostomus discolor]|uniref:Uncharacterized protein n=1 Tax=Phyllostomus discolor TaxID=89673 RepID=A0A834DLP0_9CHIR|nr:hypothetical protein HJG60_008697 [Phyllostomus discolor]